MDEDLILALQRAVNWLEEHGYRYALIGGIASQWWGIPRLTHDVDIKVLVPDLNYAAVREALRADFPGRGRPHAPRNPLIVDAIVEKATVDFLLTIPGYDEQVVMRALQCDLESVPTWICSPEDLVVQKALAGRGRDWQDIEGILIEQRDKLDLDYLEDWLTQFAEFLERPEILTQYQEIQAHIAEAVAQLNGE